MEGTYGLRKLVSNSIRKKLLVKKEKLLPDWNKYYNNEIITLFIFAVDDKRGHFLKSYP